MGYGRQVEAADRGEKPLYRPRQWKEQERRRAKSLKRAAWFRPSDAVLFLLATPDSLLADRTREVVNGVVHDYATVYVEPIAENVV